MAEQYPWPSIDGYRRRMDHVVKGLAKAGEVEVVALHRQGTAMPVDPLIAGVESVEWLPVGAEGSIKDWGTRWVRGAVPRRLLGPSWDPLRERLELRVAEGDRPDGKKIDLVWFSHVDTWWPLQQVFVGTPTIVDFDNLENLALNLRRRIPPRFPPKSSMTDRVKIGSRWVTSRAFDLIDESRWDKVQRDCASKVDRVVVCSELDVERSGCANAVVIGNGADRVDDAEVDRSQLRSDRPTLLFIGALDYEPNTEAVEWFARDVMPLLVDQVPDVRVRIVGRGAHQVAWVREVEGVDLVGSVESVGPELRSADAAIVPIRVGAGTRLKVVEALANRLPLVTTSIGCEGIELTDGLDALVVDDALGFASACARLLTDGQLRQSLADRGAELFEAHYDWEKIEAGIASLAREVVNEHR